jgi:hypothetical protein
MAHDRPSCPDQSPLLPVVRIIAPLLTTGRYLPVPAMLRQPRPRPTCPDPVGCLVHFMCNLPALILSMGT